VLAAQDAGKMVDVFRVRDEGVSKKKMKRRLKRQREKAKQRPLLNHTDHGEEAGAWAEGHPEESAVVALGEGEGEGESSPTLVATDELEFLTTLRTTAKVRGLCFSGEVIDGAVRVVLSLGNNSLELHAVSLESKECTRLLTVEALGHRSDVRALALSGDDDMLASTCNGQVKVWNARTQQCIRTASLGFGLALAFGPADRHLMVGTKDGKLHLLDLASGDCLQSEAAHTGAIWSIDVRPDGKGIVTGSADHEVKFWDFEMVEGRLTLAHARTLKMSDDVLAVRYSRTKDPDRLLVAVALLDNTVKIFYDNSLRFFLSLYGHKLPVMALDISDDNEILATGSADKTVKIWGLDFGDCHRSLLAHGDSVMALRFVPGTHYFFTCGKDRTVKYWDADHFEQILMLPGHQSEVWGLAVASDGSFVASCGHDRSLRMWERTDDQVFLEEERERELEAMFEAELDRPDKATATSRAPGTGRFVWV
jgi:U3 small nucleolar RNA-associated protein 12